MFKNKLKKRILSLEDKLGLVYAEKEGYLEHVIDDEAYGLIARLSERVEKLEKKIFPKEDK